MLPVVSDKLSATVRHLSTLHNANSHRHGHTNAQTHHSSIGSYKWEHLLKYLTIHTATLNQTSMLLFVMIVVGRSPVVFVVAQNLSKSTDFKGKNPYGQVSLL